MNFKNSFYRGGGFSPHSAKQNIGNPSLCSLPLEKSAHQVSRKLSLPRNLMVRKRTSRGGRCPFVDKQGTGSGQTGYWKISFEGGLRPPQRHFQHSIASSAMFVYKGPERISSELISRAYWEFLLHVEIIGRTIPTTKGVSGLPRLSTRENTPIPSV